mmetsp:Transcript_92266/g.232036  ORF Transcript_92266/g.232036 Transcript_92266/m.232036 type:complete len:302 (+) Transcript_92266:294-1199(+)
MPSGSIPSQASWMPPNATATYPAAEITPQMPEAQSSLGMYSSVWGQLMMLIAIWLDAMAKDATMMPMSITHLSLAWWPLFLKTSSLQSKAANPMKVAAWISRATTNCVSSTHDAIAHFSFFSSSRFSWSAVLASIMRSMTVTFSSSSSSLSSFLSCSSFPCASPTLAWRFPTKNIVLPDCSSSFLAVSSSPAWLRVPASSRGATPWERTPLALILRFCLGTEPCSLAPPAEGLPPPPPPLAALTEASLGFLGAAATTSSAKMASSGTARRAPHDVRREVKRSTRTSHHSPSTSIQRERVPY